MRTPTAEAEEDAMSIPSSEMVRFGTVTTYLSWDHDRLEAILEAVSRGVEDRRMAEARETYRGFDDGLNRHIRIEEELLFPLFEARTGIADGPTAVMRSEHREIQKALDIMRDGLAREDGETFREGLRFLHSVLPDHNAKEEHVLYPTMDRLFSESERSAFAARLQRE